MKDGKPATASRVRSAEDLRLWIALFAPIAAWIAAQQVSFLLSPWVCDTGRRWVLYLVLAAALLAAGAGGALAWKNWRSLGVAGSSGRSEEPPGNRRRLMAAGALLAAPFFLLAILALIIPVVVHRPCD